MGKTLTTGPVPFQEVSRKFELVCRSKTENAIAFSHGTIYWRVRTQNSWGNTVQWYSISFPVDSTTARVICRMVQYVQDSTVICYWRSETQTASVTARNHLTYNTVPMVTCFHSWPRSSVSPVDATTSRCRGVFGVCVPEVLYKSCICHHTLSLALGQLSVMMWIRWQWSSNNKHEDEWRQQRCSTKNEEFAAEWIHSRRGPRCPTRWTNIDVHILYMNRLCSDERSKERDVNVTFQGKRTVCVCQHPLNA